MSSSNTARSLFAHRKRPETSQSGGMMARERSHLSCSPKRPLTMRVGQGALSCGLGGARLVTLRLRGRLCAQFQESEVAQNIRAPLQIPLYVVEAAGLGQI